MELLCLYRVFSDDRVFMMILKLPGASNGLSSIDLDEIR